MLADFDPLLGHDGHAVQEAEIADRAKPIRADRKGAAGIDRDVLAEDDRRLELALEKAKALRGLAVEAFAPSNIFGNGMLPPVVFDAAFRCDVAHIKVW